MSEKRPSDGHGDECGAFGDASWDRGRVLADSAGLPPCVDLTPIRRLTEPRLTIRIQSRRLLGMQFLRVYLMNL